MIGRSSHEIALRRRASLPRRTVIRHCSAGEWSLSSRRKMMTRKGEVFPTLP